MIMNDTVKIFCENTGANLFVNQGTSLLQVAQMLSLEKGNDTPLLAAYVDNRLKELSYRIYSPLTVRFIDITHFEGMRVYQRTLFFILDKAVCDLFPDRKLHIKHAVAKGFYCEIEGMEDIPETEIGRIKERMQDIIGQNIPIVRQRVTCEEAVETYRQMGLEDKIALLVTRPHLYVTLYKMADIVGYFYGGLAISTGYIHLFDLHKYYKGFRVAVPDRTAPTQLEKEVPQSKMFKIFKEYARWVDIIGVSNIGALNSKILEGKGGELIRMGEALHEKSVGYIADRVAIQHQKGGAKIVLISGPSSSGKTTFSKRLGIQLSILGMHPVLISLDDYFVDREKTPKDADGEYDYEALEAIDLELFNDHLRRLMRGESVDIPRYNFITGRRMQHNDPLTLDERSILIVEGIHGLNPRLTPGVPEEQKFRIYISCFTSVAMDNLSRIATTDNRLLRRLTRDYRQRGADALATLSRWASVRRGEEKHIFPYQENADVMLNSSLFYEISVLRPFAEKILREVPDTVPEYDEARRMLKFLDNFIPIPPDEIPPTSILREFIGGSSFQY